MAYCSGLNVTAAQADGLLSVDSVSMQTPAWCVVSVSPLWGFNALRGDDLLIPGRVGLVAMTRRFTETTVALQMVVDGRTDSAGVPHSHPRNGLRLNLASLRSLTGGMPKSVVLTAPGGGAVFTRSAHVGLEMGDETRFTARAALTLTFPDGLHS
jgi:hypothetical protein